MRFRPFYQHYQPQIEKKQELAPLHEVKLFINFNSLVKINNDKTA